MNVYITRINGINLNIMETAAYIQFQTAEIAYEIGYREMGIYHYDANGESVESRRSRFDGMIAGLRADDVVICQFPTWNGLEFEKALVNHIKVYCCHVVIFIHDIVALMYENNRYLLKETVDMYNQAKVLIVPSYAMKEFLLENGVRADMKFVIQEIWDYTTEINFAGAPKLKKEIHFAGDLGRFLFPHHWDYHIPLKIYTDMPCKGKNVQLMGWMHPNVLLLELAKGGFGLLWPGSDYMHEYMRYNNNTKLSTYLAAGIPAIIPKGVSCQYLIEKNHLGLVVDSLEEAVERVENMTEQEYQEYIRHVDKFSWLLRKGYFTRKLLTEAVHYVFREDMS